MRTSTILRVAAVLVGTALSSSAVHAAQDCDRACLRKSAETYLGALIRHDPSSAGLASSIRYTENGADVKVGEGLWKTVLRLGEFHRIYVDPLQGSAGVFGLLDEGGEAPAIASLRLKIVDRKVTEAEAILGRKGQGIHDVKTLVENAPVEKLLAKDLRSTREQMIRAADSYFDGAQSHDPSVVLQKPGCDRFENGVKMTHRTAPVAGGGGVPQSLDCAGTLAGSLQIHAVVNRRYPVVDEEAGVVMATAVFNRPPGGAKKADGTYWPRLLFTEFFPVEQGRFTAIYAAMSYFPLDYTGNTGWQ